MDRDTANQGWEKLRAHIDQIFGKYLQNRMPQIEHKGDQGHGVPPAASTNRLKQVPGFAIDSSRPQGISAGGVLASVTGPME